MSTAHYSSLRQRIYQPLQEEGIFTWESMYGQEYALATIHPITQRFQAEIAYASESLGDIISKTVRIVQSGSDELLEMLGIPKPAWGIVRQQFPDRPCTVIGRFDFAQTPSGLKMLEFNSDTPTGIVEAYYVNEKVCSFYDLPNPNAGHNRHILTAYQDMIAHYQQLGYAVDEIAFTAVDWNIEDKGTTEYLLNQSGLKGRYVPLSMLVVDAERDRLCSWEEKNQCYRPIDILYRLHALEMMAYDQDDHNRPVGEYVFDLVQRNRLGMINPPSAFIAQSKALQALIWQVHEQGVFYTEEEHALIDKYMLPTYLDNQFLGKSAYVRKPIYGREGGAVSLYDQHGELLESDQESLYWDQLMIYQQLVELETLQVPTLRGEFTGHLLWGSFLLNGQASALLARVDGRITGDLSYLVPIYTEDG